MAIEGDCTCTVQSVCACLGGTCCCLLLIVGGGISGIIAGINVECLSKWPFEHGILIETVPHSLLLLLAHHGAHVAPVFMVVSLVWHSSFSQMVVCVGLHYLVHGIVQRRRSTCM